MDLSETSNVTAEYEPADSEILVITFAHMDFDTRQQRYWGQHAIRKAGFAGLGLVAKSNCWYPSADLRSLTDFLLERSASYKKIVLYGFSMGAYAALKYSALLKADVTIALSPQWSIKPADVWNYDRRLVKHYVEDLNSDMAILPHDMGGRMFVFYDPNSAQDKWNCEMIGARSGATLTFNAMRVPSIGHETIDLFAGTLPLQQLILLTVDNDVAALRTLTASLRRAAQRRVFNVLRHARARWPTAGASLYARHEERLSPYWRGRWAEEESAKPASQ